MRIIRTHGFIGRNPLKFRKKVNKKTEEPEMKTSMTETVDDDLNNTEITGSGMHKLRKKFEHQNIQDSENKLKKFINFKF